jgi:hypothetical protein
METGTRWAGRANPRDLTAKRQQALLKERAAREAAASDVIDIAAIKRRAYEAGHSAGWDQAIEFVIGRMTEVGLDPDILAVGDDDAGEDE